LTTVEEAAETFLTTGRLEAVQKAYTVRFIGVDAGPLSAEQASKEPHSVAKAERRLGHYGVEFDANEPTRPIAIYDTIQHRVIHSRLYTVTQVAARFDYMRMDELPGDVHRLLGRRKRSAPEVVPLEPEARSSRRLAFSLPKARAGS
jgi:hypothetical protein